MNTDFFESQLNTILNEFNNFRSKSKHDDLSDLPVPERQALITKAVAAIYRICGKDSVYAQEIKRIFIEEPYLHQHTNAVIGVVQALRDDIRAGYLRSLVELVHGDIFADFLEMAQHLCDSNYKDAAAVIAGSTIESHLRSLCQRAQIPINNIKTNGDQVPKKAEAMNSELATAEFYSKLDQKNVTAWLGLRNKAAHGEYTEYCKEQVGLLISGVRDFINRNPA